MIQQLRTAAAVVVLFCSSAAVAATQEVTQADKDRAVQYLEKTKQGVLEATKGLSDAQWNFKPGPDRWSIAQVMEHIATAEDYIRGVDAEQVMKAPAAPADHDAKKTDDAVLANIPDRSHKIQAPEPLVPTNRFGSPENSLKHFVESREKTEEFVKNTPGLRDHAADSPMGEAGWVRICFADRGAQRTAHEANPGSEGRSQLPEELKGWRKRERSSESQEREWRGGQTAAAPSFCSE